jgi:hypothetical protein
MKGDVITYGLITDDGLDYSCRNYPIDLILALTFGIIFSPWKVFLIFFVIFFIVYEFAFYYVIPHRWYPDIRGGVILAYILGWIIGRTIIGYQDVMSEDVGYRFYDSLLLPPLNFNSKK